MSHPRFGFGSEEVASRRLEERKDRRVLERRRVRYIDDDGGAFQSARQALPGDRVSSPVLGAAANASWPRSRSLATSLEPMSPVPPMMTIFMVRPPLGKKHAIRLPAPYAIGSPFREAH